MSVATALFAKVAEPATFAELAAMAATVGDGEHLVVAVANRVGPTESAFDRRTLVRVAREAGLQVRVLGVAPDHHAPRLVFADRLLDDQRTRHLARVVPSFDDDRERRRWADVVDAGLAGWMAPSLILVARRGGAPTLWPHDRLAIAYTASRHPAFATETVFSVRRGDVFVARRRLAGEDPAIQVTPTLRFDATPHQWVDGDDALEVLAASDSTQRAALIRAWRDLVPARALDAIPRNCVVRADGSPALIDQEWWSDDATHDDVLRRGVLLTAIDLAARGCGDAIALALEFAAALGLPAAEQWIGAAVDAEAVLRTTIELLPDEEVSAKQAEHARILRDALYPPQPGTPPEVAMHAARAAELEEALTSALRRADAAERELRERGDEVVTLGDEIAHLRRSLAASAELLSHEAAKADALRRDLAADTPSDAAEELAALKATKLLRWSRWPRRAYALLRRNA